MIYSKQERINAVHTMKLQQEKSNKLPNTYFFYGNRNVICHPTLLK